MMGGGGTGILGKRWSTQALIVGAYVLLALALTWPLVMHFGSHVPGNGVDDPPLTWNLWWVQYALLRLGQNPFACDYLFYPLGINLAFYTLTVLNGLLSIPWQGLLGLVPASNLLLLSSFVLSGYGAFLLADHLLRREGERAGGERLAAAFAAGLLYAFASSKMAYAALGQWNIASSQWVPFYVLYLLRMGEEPGRRRYPLLAALFLLFQAYAELTYASFLVLFTVLWAIWQGVQCLRSGRPLRRLVLDLALVGAIFLLGLAPVLAMMLPDMWLEGDIFVQGSGFADVFSADLLGFFVPTMYHPFLGSLVGRFDFDHSVGQHIYLGYSVLALAAVGLLFWKRGATAPEERGPSARVGFWALSAFVFWLLTLGPSLRVNGQDTGLPLPFALLAQLPFFKGNRYPSRYSVMLVLSLAMLVAFGLAALGQRRRAGRRGAGWLALLLVGLMLFEHLSLPLPLSDMRVPPVYRFLKAELPAEGTLLDLPLAWRNGFRVTGTQHPIIMFSQYYQSLHQRPILGGNTSRNPPLKFQYFTEAPVINTLIALETGHQVGPDIVAGDRELAADVLRFFDIGAIVVHPAQTGPEMVPYLQATMPVERVYEDAETVAYRVDLPPWPAEWQVEPGEPLSRLSYAEGWGRPSEGRIWAQRRRARLLVPLNGERQRFSFRAYAPGEGQRLAVEMSGRTIGELDLSPGWADYELELPADVVAEGLNEIWLRFETLYPAEGVALNDRAVGQTGLESPVNLVVESAGQEVGDFGLIYVDGRQVSPNERGYNVVVLDPKSGAVRAVAAFDTHLDEGASQALAGFLNSAPQGSLVAVAVADEASRLLGEEAVAALRGIGATGDLRGRFRWGQAIIGVRGAPPGSAVEAVGWRRPQVITVGEGATEPRLAAAFGGMRFVVVGTTAN